MEYAVLGRTGLRVSRVGFGGGGIGQVWGPTTEAESVRTIHRALELGVNFFDVAPGYGHGKAEDVLGRALHGIRMKLSADSLHEDESFALVLQTVTEDLRRGPSFAHRLGRQTFGSPTGLLQEVVQFACRLKDGLEPARSQRLEMSCEFHETQFALVLQPQGRPRLRTQRIIQQNAEHPSIQIT